MVPADLMLTPWRIDPPWPGRMVTFVKRFGVLRRIPLLFCRKPYRDGGKAEIESFRALEYFKGGKKDFKLDT